MKRLKFKNNVLSFKKFNQIIFEDKKISKRYGSIWRPKNWVYKDTKFKGKKAKSCYKGKISKGNFEGFGVEMILQMGTYMEDVVSYYKGNWTKGRKNGKGYWSNHHPLIGRTDSVDVADPIYSVMEFLQYDAYYYDGYWADDKKHGKGILQDEEGIFEGEFRNNIKWKGVLKPSPIPDNVATILLPPARVDKEVIINNGKKESK